MEEVDDGEDDHHSAVVDGIAFEDAEGGVAVDAAEAFHTLRHDLQDS